MQGQPGGRRCRIPGTVEVGGRSPAGPYGYQPAGIWSICSPPAEGSLPIRSLGVRRAEERVSSTTNKLRGMREDARFQKPSGDRGRQQGPDLEPRPTPSPGCRRRVAETTEHPAGRPCVCTDRKPQRGTPLGKIPTMNSARCNPAAEHLLVLSASRFAISKLKAWKRSDLGCQWAIVAGLVASSCTRTE